MGTIVDLDDWMLKNITKREEHAFENMSLLKATQEDIMTLKECLLRRKAIRERIIRQIEETN